MNNTELEGLIQEAVEKFENNFDLEEFGTVFASKDGIVKIYGLDSAFFGEIIICESIKMMVISIENDHIAALALEDSSKIKIGAEVKRTKQNLSVKASDMLLGRVLNGFGDPIDDKGQVGGILMPVFGEAPKIMDRKGIHEQLITGIKAVDWFTPIGKGQRQLILGNRGSGKSTFALATMLSIANKLNHIAIYVSIGQKPSSNRYIYEVLKSNEVENFIMLIANASDCVAMNYLAPYVGCAIAEYFRNQGRHVVIFYDDLSEQITAYRQISSSVGKAPGREAYPGDVFYRHSSLLERAACMNAAHNGGTLTAFPICKIQNGDVSSYISTNLISITDGQCIILDDKTMDSTKSVSRTGTRTKILKSLCDMLQLEYTKYLQYKNLLKFSSDLSPEIQLIIDRGRILEAILAQDILPIPEEEQILLLYAYKHKKLTKIKEFLQLSKMMSMFTGSKEEILAGNHNVIESILERVKKYVELSESAQ